MNLGELTGLLGKLQPILKVLGIDPVKMANSYGRAQLEPLFRQVAPDVVRRMEKDGLTPALKGDSPKAERQVVRSAMYLIAKEVFRYKLPRGASLAADYLRDAHDSEVVAQVSPLIDATTSTAALVELVIDTWIERIF